MNDRTVPEQCLMVIFGASGDLTARKLVPALYDLCRTQQLPRHMGVLGVSRTKMSDGEFREKMRASCADSPEFSEETWRRFAERLHYEPCDATDFAQFGGLVRRIDELRQTRNTGESLLFYLSVAPSIVEQIVVNIGVRWRTSAIPARSAPASTISTAPSCRRRRLSRISCACSASTCARSRSG